jgi:hypothetical protein
VDVAIRNPFPLIDCAALEASYKFPIVVIDKPVSNIAFDQLIPIIYGSV